MSIFRLSIPRVFRLPSLQIPLMGWLLFGYFLLSSADLLAVPLLVFKMKLTNLVAGYLFLLLLVLARGFQAPKQFLILFLGLSGSFLLSALNSECAFVCLGFLLFFAFNYFCYFQLSFQIMQMMAVDLVWKVYTLSFYCMGLYAVAQLLLSLVGILLPGTGQNIHGIARGQGFCYEPSFYALYMTPFTMYTLADYLLQPPQERKLGRALWPTLFLLASTSTGCAFSYLFFFVFLFVFQAAGWLDDFRRFRWRWIAELAVFCSGVFLALFVGARELLVSGFLKFFYHGIYHFSLQDRWRGLTLYWDIFWDHPLFGVGMGAGPYYLMLQERGYVDFSDTSIFAYFAPMNVTTEIFAGLGIVGAVGFASFFYLLIQLFRRVVRLPMSLEEKRMLVALALSLCVSFATLQFNQSIMRSYLWIHTGIFCGYAKYLQHKWQVAKGTLR